VKWGGEDFLRKRVGELQSHIHDRYFELEWAIFDAAARRFVLPFCDDRPKEPEDRDGQIVATGVVQSWIEGVDKTGAGWDLLNVLKYDEGRGLLRIKGCIWSTLVLSVTPDFCVEVVR